MGGGSADNGIVVGEGIDEVGDCLVAEIGDLAQGAAIQDRVLKGVCQKSQQVDELLSVSLHTVSIRAPLSFVVTNAWEWELPKVRCPGTRLPSARRNR